VLDHSLAVMRLGGGGLQGHLHVYWGEAGGCHAATLLAI